MPKVSEVSPLANCRPRGDRVVILRDDCAKESPGGIILPDGQSQKQTVGTVVSFGPKVEDLKKGDRVVFPAYAGTEIQGHKNGQYVIVVENDVLAVLTGSGDEK